MTTQRYDLDFMSDRALDAGRVPTASERSILRLAREALLAADAVVVHIGGKAGRLGEAIIGTAFLEGTLQTLAYTSRQHTPVTIIVDESIAELVSAAEYRARYWAEIDVIVAAPDDVDRAGAASYASASARNILELDFHAEHDGMPYLEIEQADEKIGVVAGNDAVNHTSR